MMPKRPLALCPDNSVVGGYYDDEFMADTHSLWRLKEAGRFNFVTSRLVFQPIINAPERVTQIERTEKARINQPGGPDRIVGAIPDRPNPADTT